MAVDDLSEIPLQKDLELGHVHPRRSLAGHMGRRMGVGGRGCLPGFWVMQPSEVQRQRTRQEQQVWGSGYDETEFEVPGGTSESLGALWASGG